MKGVDNVAGGGGCEGLGCGILLHPRQRMVLSAKAVGAGIHEIPEGGPPHHFVLWLFMPPHLLLLLVFLLLLLFPSPSPDTTHQCTLLAPPSTHLLLALCLHSACGAAWA